MERAWSPPTADKKCLTESIFSPSPPSFTFSEIERSHGKITQMKEITLHGQWIIKAPVEDVFSMMTDFEKFPDYFPRVAESIRVKKREGNYVEMDAIASSFGKKFPVKMKTQILPGKGFISDNESSKFGTSGHEEMLFSKSPEGTLIDYTYRVSIHKAWLRVAATPLIRWYSMKYWEKAVISELRKTLEK
ncbi:MAG: hypothetical protein PHC85_01130 [Candidatus Pacebacteria bacterium]|nr:hypothetical protein [Candidatus Paceibacterota bacterium]